MWEHIIQPIFGGPNSKKITIDELEDKFNANLREHTIILVDEFRHSDAQGSKRLENRLKLMATEGEFSMRAMHTEYKQGANFFNMIFFSNNRDAMRVEDSDRRINVGPRQETQLPITLGKGDYEAGLKKIEILIEKIEEERETFANFIHSARYSKNLAKIALKNEAKAIMKAASSTRMEDFARVLIEGSLNGLMFAAQDVPDMLNEVKGSIRSIMMSVQEQGWCEEKTTIFLKSTQLAGVYSFYQDKVASHSAMRKYLNRYVGPNVLKDANIGAELGYYIDFPYTEENQTTFKDIQTIFPLVDNVSPIGMQN